MKNAHITSRPEYELGDRVLGLCGKEFKVKVKWIDLPDDKPICRACVDLALRAMTESDKLIEQVRVRVALLKSRMESVHDILGEDLILDEIAETDLAYQDELAMRKQLKIERKREKRTCTCVWTSPEIFEEDPNCPIHGVDESAAEVVYEDVELPKEDQS